MSEVSIDIDVRKGRVKIVCQYGNTSEILGQCLGFLRANEELEKFGSAPSMIISPPAASTTAVSSTPLRDTTKPKPVETKTSDSKPKRSPGKAPDYTTVEIELSDDQKRELKAFYNEMAPKKQNDIVCVVTHKVKQLSDKDTFTVDEVFSLLRLIGGIKIPRNLTAVFGNIVSEGNGAKDKGSFVANFATDDYIAHTYKKTETS